MTSKELYEKLKPSVSKTENVQAIGGRINYNTSSFCTKLIKEAARCNAYSSDVVYNINGMTEAMRNFDPKADPVIIWFGFRRHGVDHDSYILSKIGEDVYNVYHDYFALYSVKIEAESPGYVDITFNEYWM